MSQIIVRFLIGGAVVSVFAAIGDVLGPKSFAGFVWRRAVSIVGYARDLLLPLGASYAATEARSMIAGAMGLFAYASFVRKTRKGKFLDVCPGVPILFWLELFIVGCLAGVPRPARWGARTKVLDAGKKSGSEIFRDRAEQIAVVQLELLTWCPVK